MGSERTGEGRALEEQQLSDALDACLTDLTAGQATIEECLTRYPEHAGELRPLLETAAEIRRLPQPTPRAASVAAGRRRMLRAVDQRQQSRRVRHDGLWAALTHAFGLRRGGGLHRQAVLRVAFASAALLILLVGGGIVARVWLVQTVTRTATLHATDGVVEMWSAGSSRWRPVSDGASIGKGDAIRTGDDVTAAVAFFDGSWTQLEPGTEVKFTAMSSRRNGGQRTIVLHQRRGRTRHAVESSPDGRGRFQVKTPTALSTVRGTEFEVSVEVDGTTDVAVWRGRVAVTAERTTVEVEPGQATSVQPSQPPATPFVCPQLPPPPVFPISTPPTATWTATARPTATPTLMPTATAFDPVTAFPSPTATPAESDGEPEGGSGSTSSKTTPMPVPATSTPKPSPTPTSTVQPTPEVEPTSTVEPTPTAPAPPEPPQPPEPTEAPEEPTVEPTPTASDDPTAEPTVEPTAGGAVPPPPPTAPPPPGG